MFIKNITLEGYRNIDSLSLDLSPGVNVFLGDNAQGKTNIIESIWLFSAFKSFRTNEDRDMIMNGKESCRVRGRFESGERDYVCRIELSRIKRRQIDLNGIKVKPKEVLGKFTSVLFFPEHLTLIKGGPELRRKFLDFSICQIKPQFFDKLSEYSKIIAQRNRLLKSEMPDMGVLDVYDEKTAVLSALISKTRSTYCARLEEKAKPIMYEISSGEEDLRLEYQSAEPEFSPEKMLLMLKNGRENDLRLGYTGCGAHKDDLCIYINGQDAKNFASQGQQRSCVMSMKLGEAQLLNEMYGEYPLILFDDVFSELDKNRKNYITNKIKGKQVIITTCDGDFDFENARIFRVKGGKAEVEKCSSMPE